MFPCFHAQTTFVVEAKCFHFFVHTSHLLWKQNVSMLAYTHNICCASKMFLKNSATNVACAQLKLQGQQFSSVATECGHVKKKHDLIWYETWHVSTSNILSVKACYANFFTRESLITVNQK